MLTTTKMSRYAILMTVIQSDLLAYEKEIQRIQLIAQVNISS